MKFFTRFAFVWAGMMMFSAVAGLINLFHVLQPWARLYFGFQFVFAVAAFFLAYVDTRVRK